MAREPLTPQPGAKGLEMCPECDKPFVVPVALLDLVDEGLYLLALHCKNCDRLAVGVHEDAELERLDHAHAHAIEQIAGGLKVAEITRFINNVTGLRQALKDDRVLPEDF
jgi:hypothetical protein